MSKKTVFVIMLLLTYFVFAQQTEIKIESYYINSDFCSDTNSIDIISILDLVNPAHKSEIKLLFSSEATIKSINFQNIPDKVEYEFTGKDSISLYLTGNLSRADSLNIKFSYSYPISITKDSINILDRGHRWYPLIADNISNFKITCDLPLGYDALFPGGTVTKRDYSTKKFYSWETKSPIFKGVLVIFREKMYKEFRRDLTGDIIAFYYFADDSLDIKKIITETGRMMNFCSTNIGPYRFEKLTMIEIPGLDGINICSGLLMIGSNDLKYLNRGYHDGLLLTLAEQWFGAGVFSKFGSKGFWITSLSLPHYIRMLYLKDTYGLEKFDDALVKPLEKYKEFAGGEKDIALYDINMPDTPEKAMLLYIKGPYIFHKLHEKMGDFLWWEFICNLYSAFFGKVMALEDFVTELKRYDSDGSLSEYFSKLIKQKGLPE